MGLTWAASQVTKAGLQTLYLTFGNLNLSAGSPHIQAAQYEVAS